MLPWRRFRALLMGLPRDGALSRAANGHDVVEWSLVVEQLSQIKLQLAWANWQRAGRKNATKPKPDKRPGRADQGGIRHGGKLQLPQQTVKDYLDSLGPPKPGVGAEAPAAT